MSHSLFTIAFKQACGSKGCPFCTMALHNTRRYLGTLLHEYTLAPDVHLHLAQARGFCNAHAWLFQYIAHAEQRDGMGVGILYASVIKRLLDDLREGHAGKAHRPARGHAASPLAAAALELLRPERVCPACSHQTDSEQFSLREFLDHLEETQCQGDLAALYRESAGACLIHLRELLRETVSDTTAGWLLDVAAEKFTQLFGDLEQYVRKHDVQFQHEPMGPERDSWVRVIEQTVGKRAVPLPGPIHDLEKESVR
jgi:hypothetical protein